MIGPRACAPFVAALMLACGAQPGGAGGAGGAGGTNTGGDSGMISQDGATPATGPIAHDLGPAAVAQAICKKVDQCGCNWTTSAPCVNDSGCSFSTCASNYTALYGNADRQAAGLGEVYDPAGARKCVDSIAAADCLDVNYTNLCTVIWNGTRALGESCGATQACKTSDSAPAECGPAGTCVAVMSPAPPKGPPMGGACSGTCSGTTCFIMAGASGGQCQHADGLACIGGTCQTLRKQGDPCEALACSDPLTCSGGVCAARLANGRACTSASFDNPCQIGSGCVASVCAILKPNGQACQTFAECLENNCIAGRCVRQSAYPICGN
jgi:hypothetical protein